MGIWVAVDRGSGWVAVEPARVAPPCEPSQGWGFLLHHFRTDHGGPRIRGSGLVPAGQRLTDIHRYHLGSQMHNVGMEVSLHQKKPKRVTAGRECICNPGPLSL